MHTMEIDTAGYINLDGVKTNLRVTQTKDATVVYRGNRPLPGQTIDPAYAEIKLPHSRYSLVHNDPKPLHKTPDLAAKYPAPAGRAQFEVDIRAAITAP